MPEQTDKGNLQPAIIKVNNSLGEPVTLTIYGMTQELAESLSQTTLVGLADYDTEHYAS